MASFISTLAGECGTNTEYANWKDMYICLDTFADDIHMYEEYSDNDNGVFGKFGHTRELVLSR